MANSHLCLNPPVNLGEVEVAVSSRKCGKRVSLRVRAKEEISRQPICPLSSAWRSPAHWPIL